jgi:predicted transcriptional regulator
MQPQIIYNNNKPSFAVIPWKEYEKLLERLEKLSEQTAQAPLPENPVKVARIKAGKTQVELAQALAVKQSYIAKIEAKSYKPTHQLLARVVRALCA